MSTTIQHEIEIEAPPAAVWSVLTEASSYADWNPFVRRLSGNLEEGARLEARIQAPGGRAMTFKPVVLTAEPERELRWRGRLFVPGVFDGEHRFQLQELAGGRTRFIQSERFSGILVRPLRRTLAQTLLGFEQMNAALKQRVELRSTPSRSAEASRPSAAAPGSRRAS